MSFEEVVARAGTSIKEVVLVDPTSTTNSCNYKIVDTATTFLGSTLRGIITTWYIPNQSPEDTSVGTRAGTKVKNALVTTR